MKNLNIFFLFIFYILTGCTNEVSKFDRNIVFERLHSFSSINTQEKKGDIFTDGGIFFIDKNTTDTKYYPFSILSSPNNPAVDAFYNDYRKAIEKSSWVYIVLFGRCGDFLDTTLTPSDFKNSTAKTKDAKLIIQNSTVNKVTSSGTIEVIDSLTGTTPITIPVITNIDILCDKKNLLIAEGSAANFNINVAINTKKNVTYKWILKNIWEEEVLRGEEDISKTIITFNTLKEGFYKLELYFYYEKKEISKAKKTFIVWRNLAGKTSDSRFALDTGTAWSCSTVSEMDRIMDMTKDLGVSTIRDRLSWADAERNGIYDFSKYINSMNSAKNVGLEMGTVFHDVQREQRATQSQLTAGQMSQVPLRDLFTLYKFTNSLSTNLSKADFVEIWNEPDISFFLGRPDEYATMLKAAYWGIKDSGGTKKILIGSQAYENTPFFKKAANNNIAPYFDIFNQHYYGSNWYDFYGTLNQFLTDTGLAGKPIWITETGAYVRPALDGTYTLSEEKEAEYIWKTVSSALGHGIDKVFVFYLRELLENSINLWGLIYKDFSPKPAFFSYGLLIRELSGTKVIAPIKDGYIRGTLFEREDKTQIAVLWADKESYLPSNNYTVVDLSGKREKISGSIIINSTPRIIIGSSLSNLSQDKNSLVIPTTFNAPSRLVLGISRPNDKRWASGINTWMQEKDEGIPIDSVGNQLSVRVYNFSSVISKANLVFYGNRITVDKSSINDITVPAKGFVDIPVSISISSYDGEMNFICELTSGNFKDKMSVDLSLDISAVSVNVELYAASNIFNSSTLLHSGTVLAAQTIDNSCLYNGSGALRIATEGLGAGDSWVFTNIPSVKDLNSFLGIDVITKWDGEYAPPKLLVQLVEENGGIWVLSLNTYSTEGGWNKMRGIFSKATTAPWKPDPDGVLNLDKVKNIYIGWGAHDAYKGEKMAFYIGDFVGIKFK